MSFRPANGAAQPHPEYLAIDLGASSCRAVLGTLRGAEMHMEDVYRFRTPLIEVDGHLYWETDALWHEIRTAITGALALAPTLRSVSLDSWAVDYQPLDSTDAPVRRPYAYRDPRTHGRLTSALARAGGAAAVYARTGIQLLEFNTLPQIVVDLESERALVERTATRLLLADYFLFRLSGVCAAERSMASSTQLMDVATGGWATDLIEAIGDRASRWPIIVDSGTLLGPMLPALLPVGARHLPQVIATCSHDTACAVAAVPAEGRDPWAYICSGTWSLVGAELPAPIVTAAACAAGFTNEAGLDGTIRFLKNRTGMWVLEECLREWQESGDTVSYGQLVGEAAAAEPSSGVISFDAPEFALRGDMVRKIGDACAARGLSLPTARGALVRLIFDSLAQCYADTIDELDGLTGRRTEVVHIVGGGARNALLNQLTADATARRVIAGPAEATVLGNLLVQARTLGDLPHGVSVREVAKLSTTLSEFTPRGLAVATRVSVTS